MAASLTAGPGRALALNLPPPVQDLAQVSEVWFGWVYAPGGFILGPAAGAYTRPLFSST